MGIFDSISEAIFGKANAAPRPSVCSHFDNYDGSGATDPTNAADARPC
jgi:hypothetical protein